jgi:hypothetical protein
MAERTAGSSFLLKDMDKQALYYYQEWFLSQDKLPRNGAGISLDNFPEHRLITIE